MKTTQEIAVRLVELCRLGKFEETLIELYADDAVSIEPSGSPMPNSETLEGIIKKGREFRAGLEEIHGLSISDPITSGNVFAITFVLDATFKGTGRSSLEEICAYKVNDGKIISEQFIY